MNKLGLDRRSPKNGIRASLFGRGGAQIHPSTPYPTTLHTDAGPLWQMWPNKNLSAGAQWQFYAITSLQSAYSSILSSGSMSSYYWRCTWMDYPGILLWLAESMGSTGLSASGIHFGHYIAGTFNPEILVINATLANIPICTSFTYDCWKKGVNMMIKKMCGNFNVEKLWIILLFEAGFNANNKWIGWAVM